MAQPEKKLQRHLRVSEETAKKLVKAGFLLPRQVKGATKTKLRKAGLTKSESDKAKARWAKQA
jgi:hypothetical protein